MPIFGSHREPSPEVYAPERNIHEPVPKKHGLFHRREEPIHDVPVETTTSPTHKHSLFHRRDRSPTTTNRTISTRSSTSSSSSVNHRTSRRGGSLLHRAMGRTDEDVDPSILQARERVMSAEEAEEQADLALDQARLRVREAREHMKRVEAEAEEEARRAKIKQQHVREVTKRGKGLGREYFLCVLFCLGIVLICCSFRTWYLSCWFMGLDLDEYVFAWPVFLVLINFLCECVIVGTCDVMLSMAIGDC